MQCGYTGKSGIQKNLTSSVEVVIFEARDTRDEVFVVLLNL